MPATVQAKCPRCQKLLRIPADWLDMSMRCKHCQQPLHAKVRSRPAGSAPAPAMPAAVNPPLPPPAPAPTQAPAPYGTFPPAPMPATLLPTEPVMPAVPPQYGAPNTAFSAQPQFAPPPPPKPTGPPSSLAFEGSRTLVAPAGRQRAKSGSGGAALFAVLGGVFLLFVVGAAAGAWALGLFGPNKPTEPVASEDEPPPAPGTGAFPRRLLVVSVNNYLYANSLNFGADAADDPMPLKHSVQNVAESLAGQLRIPKDQTFLLTDGMTGANSRPPLRPIIEQTISRFADTSRAQDRIVVLFAGHAIEIDGEAFLVPLEGDLRDKKSLLPLTWVFEKINSSKAQQKCLILDVFRYDPGRGSERVDTGPMSPKFEEIVSKPPAGLQVWTSCSANQRSMETEFDGIRDPDLKMDIQMRGSVFLNLFFYASQKGNKAGIQRQSQPINFPAYSDVMGKYTESVVGTLRKETVDGKSRAVKQLPRLHGTVGKGEVAFNADEPPAPSFQFPTAGEVLGSGQTDKAKIRALLAEVSVPSLKVARRADTQLPLEEVLPFPADVMKKYDSDGVSIEAIKKDAETYPVRVAVLEAMELLNSIKTGKTLGKSLESTELPEELRSAANDAVKKDFFKIQMVPAKIQAHLTETRDKLEMLADARGEEKSPRWQAHYDFILAMVKVRLAYMHEYNLMLAKVRKDELPDLDSKANQTGWRLASLEKPQSKEAKDLSDEARKAFIKIVKDHPGTPWEVLAKRERLTSPGLKWEAVNFGDQ